jgi:hypothetical protein
MQEGEISRPEAIRRLVEFGLRRRGNDEGCSFARVHLAVAGTTFKTRLCQTGPLAVHVARHGSRSSPTAEAGPCATTETNSGLLRSAGG